MNRFEQLIEYVINDEEQKARELFHEIVVEKSRQIYENLMTEEAKEEEELDEAKHEEELDEAAEEELDEAADEEVEEAAMGGDAADDLIDEVEMDEESDINMEADDEAEVDVDVESSSEPATKDDIMNLEDKLDELMAEFEQLMGSDAADDMDDDMGDGDDMAADEAGDAIEMDDTDEMMPMAEAVSLKAAPKPTTSEEGSVNKKSTVAANSGAAGMQGKPVKTDSTDEKGRKAPDAKDLITDFQNKAGAEMKAQKAAPKPVTSQESGVNTRTPFPKG